MDIVIEEKEENQSNQAEMQKKRAHRESICICILKKN